MSLLARLSLANRSIVAGEPGAPQTIRTRSRHSFGTLTVTAARLAARKDDPFPLVFQSSVLSGISQTSHPFVPINPTDHRSLADGVCHGFGADAFVRGMESGCHVGAVRRFCADSGIGARSFFAAIDVRTG